MHACAGLVGAAGEDGDASGVQQGPEQGRDVASASAGVEEGKEDPSTVVIRLGLSRQLWRRSKFEGRCGGRAVILGGRVAECQGPGQGR